MKKPLRYFQLAWLFFGLCIATVSVHAKDDLAYQRRDHYWEGINPKPVAGSLGLTLIAALAKAKPSPTTGNASKQFHARFFLATPQQVDLVVQEYEPKDNYLLDKVAPSTPWQPGFDNDFAWPTAPVIDKLGLKLDDLAAVVRLNAQGPSPEETVAPVLLYSTPNPPHTIESYVFSFYLGKNAQLDWQVQEHCNGNADNKKASLGKKPGGSVVDVEWPAAGQSAGDYCLVVEGKKLDPPYHNIFHTVHFHHQPNVQ